MAQQPPSRPTPRIVIIGAGFSGLCLGIQLKQAGIETFTILEKSAGLGGTWRDNTYPGAACDSPIFAYCFSFEQKTDWSRKWVAHDEILAYQEHCAEKYGLHPHLRFSQEVESARFDGARGAWQIRTTGGEEYEAEILISSIGQLNRPAIPAIPGLDSFAGTAFHSARWDHGCDLTGKTVGVIGTAASAVQLIPAIAPDVKQLHVFQRSPNWLVPKLDRPFREDEKRRFARHPWLSKLYRWWLWVSGEIFLLPAILQRPFMTRRLQHFAEQHLANQVADPELRARLRPDYPIGGKRILITDDYYPALTRENVELICDDIERIDEQGVVTRDGRHVPADVLVFATGFETTNFLAPMKIEGPDGTFLADAWKDGAEAYLGLTVAGFPNFFMTYGPNTNLGHNSIVFMIECQTRYILDCIRQMRALGMGRVEVRRDVMGAYNESLQKDLAKTAWARTGKSWYKDERGRITNNWSGSTVRYWWKTRRANLAVFDVKP